MKRIVLIFIATACTALDLYAQPAPTYTLNVLPGARDC